MKRLTRWRDALLFVGIMAAAVGLSTILSRIYDDNNPFASAVFILATALVAWRTDGYRYGIAASLLGTFFVNYLFTRPFWEFDISLPGYPLTFAVMLGVSIIISALTTQIKQQEQLRFEAEGEKLRANLLRAIAHDLRTPLASIVGASSALTTQSLSEEDRAALAVEINRQAQWLVRITENLLSVTRFSGGDVTLQKTDEVLEEIIGSAIVKYRRNPGALPVAVDKPQDILVVPMDATLIEQVLQNLFDNVNAHAGTAKGIWVTVTALPDVVRVAVEDDGAGLKPGQAEAVFSGAAPLAGDRGGERHGMGIGLSVCRSIIRAHGGELTAGDSPRGGARFTFELPME